MKFASSLGKYEDEWYEGDWYGKGEVPAIIILAVCQRCRVNKERWRNEVTAMKTQESRYRGYHSAHLF
jgi:hypothetical protein